MQFLKLADTITYREGPARFGALAGSQYLSFEAESTWSTLQPALCGICVLKVGP